MTANVTTETCPWGYREFNSQFNRIAMIASMSFFTHTQLAGSLPNIMSGVCQHKVADLKFSTFQSMF